MVSGSWLRAHGQKGAGLALGHEGAPVFGTFLCDLWQNLRTLFDAFIILFFTDCVPACRKCWQMFSHLLEELHLCGHYWCWKHDAREAASDD